MQQLHLQLAAWVRRGQEQEQPQYSIPVALVRTQPQALLLRRRAAAAQGHASLAVQLAHLLSLVDLQVGLAQRYLQGHRCLEQARHRELLQWLLRVMVATAGRPRRFDRPLATGAQPPSRMTPVCRLLWLPLQCVIL